MLKLILVSLLLHSITVLASNNMSNDIVGSYKLEKSDGFDAFLKEIGIGFLKRQAASKLHMQIAFGRPVIRRAMQGFQ